MIRRIVKPWRTLTLARDKRGMALIEFAMTLPVLVMLFLGSYQLLDAVSAYRKVGRTVRTLADLTTQNTSMTAAQADTILAASTQVMSPYSPSNATMRITQINVNSSGQATVGWSRALNTTPLTTGASFSLPPGLVFGGLSPSYIYSEITYTYTPQFAAFIGTIPFTQVMYMSPRKSAYISPKTGPLT